MELCASCKSTVVSNSDGGHPSKTPVSTATDVGEFLDLHQARAVQRVQRPPCRISLGSGIFQLVPPALIPYQTSMNSARPGLSPRLPLPRRRFLAAVLASAAAPVFLRAASPNAKLT